MTIVQWNPQHSRKAIDLLILYFNKLCVRHYKQVCGCHLHNIIQLLSILPNLGQLLNNYI